VNFSGLAYSTWFIASEYVFESAHPSEQSHYKADYHTKMLAWTSTGMKDYPYLSTVLCRPLTLQPIYAKVENLVLDNADYFILSLYWKITQKIVTNTIISMHQSSSSSLPSAQPWSEILSSTMWNRNINNLLL
jgi:hypothetical protein